MKMLRVGTAVSAVLLVHRVSNIVRVNIKFDCFG